MLSLFSNLRLPSGRVTRREWLRLSGLAGLGLPLAANLQAASKGRKYPGFGKAKSVLLIFAGGGQSQLDMWDPKPDAPEEIRGEFQAIRSKVPGILLGEHMPRLAKLTDKYAIIRSVTHDDTDHGSATYLALTGNYHTRKSSNPPPTPNDFPTLGAIVKKARPTVRFPYSAVTINGPLLSPELPSPGQNAGLLGRDHDPLVLGDVTADRIAITGLDPLPELSADRITQRRSLLQSLESKTSRMQENQQLLEMNIRYRQAYELLSAPQCREAFDLEKEPDKVRNRYGKHRSGQACLLGRRLVEAGVPFTTVFFNHMIRGQDKTTDATDMFGWDTHNDVFGALKNHLLPRFDMGFSALLEDMDQRGLLKDTLVVCMGEFGRAPRVALEKGFAGSSPGRKHWASVYSIVMAGAGVTPGTVVGESDHIGGHPKSNPVGPWDVAATMYSALGIDPEGHYQDSTSRPYAISLGKPIVDLYR